MVKENAFIGPCKNQRPDWQLSGAGTGKKQVDAVSKRSTGALILYKAAI
jgi:hypothetical protein